jgi:hypothetical protein
LRRRLHVALAQLVPLVHHRRQLPEHPLGPADIRRVAFDDDFLLIGADLDVELRLEQLEVLVKRAEQRLGPFFRQIDFSCGSGGRDRSS